jgi:N-acetylneuraminate synthase/N,N'-diacetyllegionaminate synthase
MEAKSIKIENRVIGERFPCFIIAEAGVNHNGKLDLAKKMVEVAAEAGVDAIKFQTFRAEKIVSQFTPKAEYQKRQTDLNESQLEMLKKYELGWEEFKILADFTRQKNLIFLSSPFDEESADFLEEIGVSAYKIPSGEITNLPLLQHIAQKKKPILLSTGMATLGEVEAAVEVLKSSGATEIALLHCVSNYPTSLKEVNLRVMESLRSAFRLLIGFSDHTLGVTASLAAVAMGASIIEKHFTLDKKMPGPDHQASLSPKELKKLVQGIREVEEALGDGVKKLTAEEKEIKRVIRKKIVARRNLPAGTVISFDCIALKRSPEGLDPQYLELIFERKTKVQIARDEPITLDKLE